MSLVLLANVCSHLQNVTKARLGATSIPVTKQILAVALVLQREGFISSVTRGDVSGPDSKYTPTTTQNIGKRRLWLGLKYYDNTPVMSKLSLISKPKQRTWLNLQELQEIADGKPAKFVKGLVPGECIILSTDQGLFELREALERRIGGQPLLRVS